MISGKFINSGMCDTASVLALGWNDWLDVFIIIYLCSFCTKAVFSFIYRPVELSKKARGKFIDYINNKGGELGELLLYCFLESHLKAPKILSKLELKTSTNHYT
jgi:hypothetical protein